MNGLPSFHLATWRIPGVLQRIAIAYFAAAMITLYCRTYARVLWIGALLAGYWMLMRYVPVPGYGMPGRDIPFLDPNANLAAYLDRKLMMGHLYAGNARSRGPAQHLAGDCDDAVRRSDGRVAELEPQPSAKDDRNACHGRGCTDCGRSLERLVSHQQKSVDQFLRAVYRGMRAALPGVLLLDYGHTTAIAAGGRWRFVIFGTNAIAAYVLSELLGCRCAGRTTFSSISFAPDFLPAMASLLYSLAIVGLCFLPVWWMYRRGIFLKV